LRKGEKYQSEIVCVDGWMDGERISRILRKLQEKKAIGEKGKKGEKEAFP
jgi:hypothetical protein